MSEIRLGDRIANAALNELVKTAKRNGASQEDIFYLRRGRTGAVIDRRTFTKDELNSITSLSIKNGDHNQVDLNDLLHFKNLKHLDIDYVRHVPTGFAYSPQEKAARLKKELSQELDASMINRLENLRTLGIRNGLVHVDVSDMKKLTDLELGNNINLRKVEGLDTLETLETLKIFGSKDVESFDMSEVKRNNESLTECVFDMVMFPGFMKKSLNFEEDGQSKSGRDGAADYRVSFVERHSHINFAKDEYSKMGSFQARQAYKKALQVLDDNTSSQCNDYENFFGLYRWVVKNIKYDHENLEKEKRLKPDDFESRSKDMRYNVGDRIRSSHSALMEGKVVCAGYANLMVLLCKCANIDCSYVSCNTKGSQVADSEIRSNHAIIKVRMGNKTYYCDPTRDAGSYLESGDISYFMRNKSEISQTHTLSYLEALEPDSKSFTMDDIHMVMAHYNGKMGMAGKRERTAGGEGKT